jgi:hypothetical protein
VTDQELAMLLNTAATVIEDPATLSGAEKLMLVKDLLYEAHIISHRKPLALEPQPFGDPPKVMRERRAAKITLTDIKESDGWEVLATELGLTDNLKQRYFKHGEYANLEIIVNHVLEIVGGRILPQPQTRPEYTATRGMTADIPPPKRR